MMPTIFIFLLKVNVALLLFCAGYYMVLRHLTFYTLNRIYLIAAILFASIYPKINLSAFAERHREFAKPIQAVVLNWQAPTETFIKPLAKPDYWFWFGIVVLTGAALLTLRLFVQLFSLYKLYRDSAPAILLEHQIRMMKTESAPFSFWSSIFINPDNHDPADIKAILMHEQVHVNEWHTLDILLAELSTIFYWFNPGIWLMKKAIRENIEYITDRKILNKGIDSKQYQYSLINVSFAARPQGIVNHFNVSTIKKRIIMMNSKRSSRFTITRYLVLVPFVVALLLVFSVSKAALLKKSTDAIKLITANTFESVALKTTAKSRNEIIVSNIKPATVPVRNLTMNVANVSLKSKPDTSKKIYLQLDADSIPNGLKIKKNGKDVKPTKYVINGVISGEGDMKILDPTTIAGIDVEDKGDNQESTVYITTKKAIKGKTPNIIDIGGRNVSSTMVYKWDNNDTAKHKITSAGVTNYTYDLPAKSSQYLTLQKSSGINSTQDFTQFTINTNKFSLNHISDKLIIMNGNIASENDLKKLPAFDIDRMVLKTDEETKDIYGDKAKNGVLFITTKKSGK